MTCPLNSWVSHEAKSCAFYSPLPPSTSVRCSVRPSNSANKYNTETRTNGEPETRRSSVHAALHKPGASHFTGAFHSFYYTEKLSHAATHRLNTHLTPINKRSMMHAFATRNLEANVRPFSPELCSPAGMQRLHAELIETFSYNPEEGAFRWKVSPSPRAKVGCVAGSVSPGKGVAVPWRGRTWSEAQLAVFYMTGQLPVDKVQRWDGDRSTSRFENLIYTLPDGRRFQGSEEITPHV